MSSSLIAAAEPSIAVKPIRILLVEDQLADVELTRELLQEARVPNDLHVVGDADAALAFLRHLEPYPGSPHIDLVLLDIKLPGRSGLEVLSEIKGDPLLRTIPVIVLTTSAADEDVVAAYQNYVNSYVRKPLDYDEFLEVVRAIDDFWLRTVRYPPADQR
jgi:CheY-like chemotaxis protein